MFRSWYDALNWWQRKRGKPQTMPRCLATPEETQQGPNCARGRLGCQRSAH